MTRRKTPPEPRGRCDYSLFKLPRVSATLIEDRFWEMTTQYPVLEIIHESAIDNDDKTLERGLTIELFDPIDTVKQPIVAQMKNITRVQRDIDQ